MKRTPLKRGGPLKRTSGLRRRSAKLQVRMREYVREAAWYLAQHPQCACAFALFGESLGAEDIHHMAGRGPNLLAKETWLPVSRRAHDWIHRHPKEARARGWLK